MNCHGFKRTIRRPFWLNHKKHFCPVCCEQLVKVEVSRIVNWKSEEAENFDFGAFEGSLIGNIKFIWEELYCPTCQNNYKIDEIFQIEKEAKQRSREVD